MPVIFVKKIPESFGDLRAISATEDDGYRWAAIEKDDSSYYLMFEDFQIDASNPYIARRFKESVLAQWHGKWASEAPMFTEYLNLTQKKFDLYSSWVSSMLTHRRILTEDDTELALPNLADPMVVSQLEERRDSLTAYLEGEINALREADGGYTDSQVARSFYESLPRPGEIIVVREQGNYIVVDVAWSSTKELNVICKHALTGVQISIPMSELTLSPTGVWIRETLGFVENAQDVLRWFRTPVVMTSQFFALWKYKIVFRLFRVIDPVGILERGLGRSAVFTLLYNIPEYIGDGFDGLVSSLSQFETVRAVDSSLPLGQRTYINAITGTEIETSEAKSLLDKARDFVYGAGEIASDVASKAGKTVETMFYGAIVLGGIGIMYKLLN